MGTEGKLVRPCDNPQCSGRVHPECAKTQYQSNNKSKSNKKCGNCTKPIVVKRTTKFNKNKCCGAYAKIFFVAFMIIIGSPAITILALGKTITTKWVQCNPNIHPCDDGAVGTILFSLLFILLFWQFPRCCFEKGCCWKYDIFCYGDLRSRIGYKPYLTMIIMYLISAGLIVLAHCIGYPIVKSMFGMDVFFTWRTSLAGFIVYSIVVATLVIGLIVCAIGGNIYECTMKEFSEPEIIYGVTIINDETERTGLIQ